jgi:hypothetical protein
VTESNEAYPPGHPAYEAVRELCAKQRIFDEIEFGPLLGVYDEVLTVAGSVEVPPEADDITLTLWRGTRDGDAAEATPAQLWLQIATATPDGDKYDETITVDPEASDLGLVLPAFFRPSETAQAVRILLDLLAAAAPTHVGLSKTARAQNFEHLDEAVQDGFDASVFDDGYADGRDEEVSSELGLHAFSANSGFTAISFSTTPIDGFEVFATRVVLPTMAGDVNMAAWFVPNSQMPGEQSFILDVEGRVQEMPADHLNTELNPPLSEGISRVQIGMGVQYLKSLHMHAFDLYLQQLGSFRGELSDALGAVAANALAGEDPLPLEVLLPGGSDIHGLHLTGSAWHLQLEEFTRLCRLGLLGSVVVEESPQGPGLNVRAATLDPITAQEVSLQVYWQHHELSGEPVHMLSAGTATHPAHGGDPEHPELLAGFPQSSRDHILHAIDHLHDLADIAADIAAAKDADVMAMLSDEGVESDPADLVLGQMQAEALEDALAAMNGIARLYTGSHADRGIRNS